MLITFLKNPSIVKKFSPSDWQVLVNQGKISNLLGRCYFILKNNHLLTEVPKYVLWHFESAYKVANRQKLATHYEVDNIHTTLRKQGITPIFLKGAAYSILGVNCSFGRVFSDIDVLIKKEELQKAETQFFINGWLRMEVDDYDDKYYRVWMHEIPPLRHCKRASIVDLHHNLLPLTNKNTLKIEQLSTQYVENKWSSEQIKVLSNEEIIIHSSIHLFTEGEFTNGLRDLSDLDMLIREFLLTDDNFLNKLIIKAKELELFDYVWLTMRYTSFVFNTPTNTNDLLDTTRKSSIKTLMLDFCYLNVFQPNHSSCKNWKTPIAKFLLYWRGHLLRMPLRLLIPHLTRKSWMALKDTFTKEKDPNENMIP